MVIKKDKNGKEKAVVYWVVERVREILPGAGLRDPKNELRRVAIGTLGEKFTLTPEFGGFSTGDDNDPNSPWSIFKDAVTKVDSPVLRGDDEVAARRRMKHYIQWLTMEGQKGWMKALDVKVQADQALVTARNEAPYLGEIREAYRKGEKTSAYIGAFNYAIWDGISLGALQDNDLEVGRHQMGKIGNGEYAWGATKNSARAFAGGALFAFLSHPKVGFTSEADILYMRQAAAREAAAEYTQHVFWSGGRLAEDAARSFADANNGVVIGDTVSGRSLASATEGIPWSQAKPQWTSLSEEFARTASGEVNVFQNAQGLKLDSIWRNEYMVLKENPNVTKINMNIVLPDGSVMQVP
ncbi:MAG: hypothetical protein L6R28_14205 [Planctomycetes bacterium]|nr:hypothetical protein [Planctomycetota bacterium]